MNRTRLLLFVSIFASVVGYSYAQPDAAIEKAVNDVAGDFKAGKHEAARKKAIAAAKNIEDPGDLMRLFGPKKKGGLDIGVKLMKLPKDAKEVEDLGNKTAAMAELARGMVAPKKKGAQAWIAEADNLRKAGLDLAKAAAKNNAKGMKDAAEKANATCISCHSKFK